MTTNALVGWAPDLGEPTTFVLVRHGVTPLTREKRFSGFGGADPALTAEGEQQVADAAAFLSDHEQHAALGRYAPFTRVDAIVASPLLRTQQTAEALSAKLGLPIETDDGVRECGFGEWDGLTYAEVSERWPDELAAWLASSAHAPPGGESFDAVFARVSAARAALAERYRGKTVAIATHVTPIKSFVRDVLGAPATALYRMELAAASISVVQWYADGAGSLRTFNGTAHLTP